MEEEDRIQRTETLFFSGYFVYKMLFYVKYLYNNFKFYYYNDYFLVNH